MHGWRADSGFFESIEAAKPGALIIYPGGKKGVGHVGIVTQVLKGAAIKVLHCSAGNYRKLGDAIAETGPEVWKRDDARFLWYCGLRDGFVGQSSPRNDNM